MRSSVVKNVDIKAENHQYEAQLNGRMMRLLNAYMTKFKDLPLVEKESIIKETARKVENL